MTLEGNVSDSDVDFMRSLREQPAEASDSLEPSQGTEPTATPEQPAESASAPQTPAPSETTQGQEQAELERLRRIIATNPQYRQDYEQQLLAEYGYAPEPVQPYAQPAPQPVQQYQQPQQQPAQQLPFDPQEFDITNYEHLSGLLSHMLEQRLQPAFEFINEQKQEEARLMQQQAIQQITESQKLLLDEIEKQVPGYSKAFEFVPGQGYGLAEKVSEEQMAVVQHANTLFGQELANFPKQLHQDPRVLKDVLNRIAPRVKKLADRLGISQGQPQTQSINPAMQQASYVETSNAAPVQSSNMFTEALKRHDDVGMMAALRRMQA